MYTLTQSHQHIIHIFLNPHTILFGLQLQNSVKTREVSVFSIIANSDLCMLQEFSEDMVEKLIVDLQAQIHNKDYQLQLINSSSIILRDKVR